MCATGGGGLRRQDPCVPVSLCPQLARNFGKSKHGVDTTHAHDLKARGGQFLAQIVRVVLTIARRYIVCFAGKALCVRTKQKVTAWFKDSDDFTQCCDISAVHGQMMQDVEGDDQIRARTRKRNVHRRRKDEIDVLASRVGQGVLAYVESEGSPTWVRLLYPCQRLT